MNLCFVTNLDHNGNGHVITTCEKCGRAIDVYVMKGHFISSVTFSGLEKLCRDCLSDSARKQMDEFLASYGKESKIKSVEKKNEKFSATSKVV